MSQDIFLACLICQFVKCKSEPNKSNLEVSQEQRKAFIKLISVTEKATGSSRVMKNAYTEKKKICINNG